MQGLHDDVAQFFRGSSAREFERDLDLHFLSLLKYVEIGVEEGARDGVKLDVVDEGVLLLPESLQRDDGGLPRSLPDALKLEGVDGDGRRGLFRPVENGRHRAARAERVDAVFCGPFFDFKSQHAQQYNCGI